MDNPFSLMTVSQLIGVMILVLANGFFVAAEFALVAVRRSRVEQLVTEAHPAAKNLQRAVRHLDAYLAATQLGITMASLGLGWLGEPAISHLLEPTLEKVLPESIATVGSSTIAIVFAFIVMTSLHIVLGELAPKSLALQRPEGTSLWVIKPLEVYLAIFRPAVQFLNGLGNLVLSLLGLQIGGEEAVHSPEEIRLLIAASRQAGLVGIAEEQVVERVFRLGEQRIQAFTTPRIDLIWLDVEDPIAVSQQTVITSVYSYFPVCQGEVDNLLGFVKAKDFLAATVAEPLSLTQFMRLVTPPLYVPEIMSVFNALEMFKQTGNRIAAVVDEYGVLQGVITLNDVLEAILGNIQTGDEPAEPQAVRREDGSWILDGALSVDEVQDILGIRESHERERPRYQTLSGLIITEVGYVPKVSQSCEWRGFQIEVLAMDRNRVQKALVQPLEKDKSEGEAFA